MRQLIMLFLFVLPVSIKNTEEKSIVDQRYKSPKWSGHTLLNQRRYPYRTGISLVKIEMGTPCWSTDAIRAPCQLLSTSIRRHHIPIWCPCFYMETSIIFWGLQYFGITKIYSWMSSNAGTWFGLELESSSGHSRHLWSKTPSGSSLDKSNNIIPDLVIRASQLSGSNSVDCDLGIADHIEDFKRWRRSL